MEVTRRGLFGMLSAAAVGVAMPKAEEPKPEEPRVITVKLQLDGKELARQIMRELPRQLRATGAIR